MGGIIAFVGGACIGLGFYLVLGLPGFLLSIPISFAWGVFVGRQDW